MHVKSTTKKKQTISFYKYIYIVNDLSKYCYYSKDLFYQSINKTIARIQKFI